MCLPDADSGIVHQLIHVRSILVKMVEPVTVTLETSHVVVLQDSLEMIVARAVQLRELIY